MNAPKNLPAFPREDYQADDAPGQRGMSLRDWFAGQALVGLLSSGTWHNCGTGFEGFIADKALLIADAMLAEREKGGAA